MIAKIKMRSTSIKTSKKLYRIQKLMYDKQKAQFCAAERIPIEIYGNLYCERNKIFILLRSVRIWAVSLTMALSLFYSIIQYNLLTNHPISEESYATLF